jgi:AcrR family transcriptional regulator
LIAKQRPHAGRPTRDASVRLADTILAAATSLLLREGFAGTSMEAVAAAAGVSKRTLYARFPHKAALLQAAVSGLIARWLPRFDSAMQQATTLEEALLQAARVMLATALVPEALALYHLVIADGGHLPELGRLLHEAGAGAGIARIASWLERGGVADPLWAAEQFQTLVVSTPQRRALACRDGAVMSEAEQEAWCRRVVALFLHGVA